ncbi:hypothetical protein HU200_066510 [Digitaria exilis]|uniref:Protein kinase domain-containing protein n=1 Tax=Digitaria exilis TaxID=1010633 RepID=A0A835DX16_9POAL|nr:hypothetical protein HU200_066510 [Digitaria exilis]
MVLLWKEHKRQKRRAFFDKNGGEIIKNMNIKTFTESQLEKMTNHYDTLIGRGAFGKVFRGTTHENLRVAVKRSVVEGMKPSPDHHLVNEIAILFQYVANGSLYNVLHGGSTLRVLPLPARLDIAIGSAKALADMHSHGGRSLVHGDVKPGNILLGDNFTPKISDFGSSKLESIARHGRVMADMSYIDPSDVYSFGVVLLELITRKTARYANKNSLPVDFVKCCKEEGNCWPLPFHLEAAQATSNPVGPAQQAYIPLPFSLWRVGPSCQPFLPPSALSHARSIAAPRRAAPLHDKGVAAFLSLRRGPDASAASSRTLAATPHSLAPLDVCRVAPSRSYSASTPPSGTRSSASPRPQRLRQELAVPGVDATGTPKTTSQAAAMAAAHKVLDDMPNQNREPLTAMPTSTSQNLLPSIAPLRPPASLSVSTQPLSSLPCLAAGHEPDEPSVEPSPPIPAVRPSLPPCDALLAEQQLATAMTYHAHNLPEPKPSCAEPSRALALLRQVDPEPLCEPAFEPCIFLQELAAKAVAFGSCLGYQAPRAHTLAHAHLAHSHERPNDRRLSPVVVAGAERRHPACSPWLPLTTLARLCVRRNQSGTHPTHVWSPSPGSCAFSLRTRVAGMLQTVVAVSRPWLNPTLAPCHMHARISHGHEHAMLPVARHGRNLPYPQPVRRNARTNIQPRPLPDSLSTLLVSDREYTAAMATPCACALALTLPCRTPCALNPNPLVAAATGTLELASRQGHVAIVAMPREAHVQTNVDLSQAFCPGVMPWLPLRAAHQACSLTYAAMPNRAHAVLCVLLSLEPEFVALHAFASCWTCPWPPTHALHGHEDSLATVGLRHCYTCFVPCLLPIPEQHKHN